jgi:hypothetical protein
MYGKKVILIVEDLNLMGVKKILGVHKTNPQID